jgi:hypothetical protein
MRIWIILTFVFLSSGLVLADDVKWHKFFVGGVGDKQFLKIDEVSLTIQTRDIKNADFKEDHLVITVLVPNQKPRHYWIDSSYGFGEVAVNGGILLLKYGVGRGTYAREDHVRALQLFNYLEELVDVKSSYYVLTDPHHDDPDLIEYQLKIQAEGDYTTLIFSLPKPQTGMPSEKIVRLKSNAQPPRK